MKNKTGHVIAAKTVRAIWVTVWDVKKRAESNREESHLESKNSPIVQGLIELDISFSSYHYITYSVF